MQASLETKIGLKFDQTLVIKYPDIVASLPSKNNNTCSICFTDFDINGTYEKPFSLVCGHQYCSYCWSHYLKSKVADEGAMCVFSKCPQLRCNVVIPHSVYQKFLKSFNDSDQMNYLDKYH